MAAQDAPMRSLAELAAGPGPADMADEMAVDTTGDQSRPGFEAAADELFDAIKANDRAMFREVLADLLDLMRE